MRELLAAALFLNLATAADIGLNLPCNRELDGLLSADPDGNPSAFLSCQSDGYGASGYWERKVCPGGMIFDFINQQCRERKYRKQPMLNIAILNNSCAHGEMCIGGTVCDQERLRCLCPYGTVPQLDTLSCAKAQGSFFQENFNFNSFGNADKSPVPGSFIPNPTPTSQAPNFFGPSSFSFAPIFRKENGPNVINTDGRDGQHFGTHSNAGNDGSEYSAPSTGERFGANSGGQWSGAVPPAQGTSENARGGFNGGNGFGDLPPRPEVETQPPFIFQPNMLAATTPPPPSKMPMLVGIGALCSELAECDHGSTCVMGRCACVAPLIQHEGRCLLRSERKEVVGQVPTYVPEVVRPSSLHPYTPPATPSSVPPPVFVPSTTPPAPVYTQPTTQPPPPPTRPVQPMQPFSQTPYRGQYVSSQGNNERPHTTYTAPQATYKYNYQTTAPPGVRPSGKPNHMKISLGGSKQSGVGVACSLNTDCMIGAYCNGNTNPPSCQCLSTHVNVEGRCERVIYPGQVGCRSDLQCTAAYTGTSCVDRVCVCPNGFKEVDHTCVSASEPVTSPPGGSCTDARICIGGAVCREGWCICPDPTMIVHRGICIQPGPRPTLPPSTAPYRPHQQQTQQPSSTSQRASTQTHYVPTAQTQSQPSSTYALQGRKVAPGSNCGPLDSCVGGAMCVDGLCVCPPGLQASPQGRCEPPVTATSAPSTSSAFVLTPGTPTYARPGQKCVNGETCVAGSRCNEKGICGCPPERPLLQGDECVAQPQQYRKTATPGESCDENTVCTQGSSCHSGQCRCQYGFIAISGHCVALPMPTTPTMKNVVLAKPLDSCDNGEQCEGGSSCDEDTGVCMCPPGHIVFGVQCQLPPNQPATVLQPVMTPSPTSASSFGSSYPSSAASQTSYTQTYSSQSTTTECSDDTNCHENKICVVGRCKCKPGFVDHDGVCKPLEGLVLRKLKYGQRCENGKDTCTFGAVCIDSVCKCGQGYALSTNGWCEPFDFKPSGKNAKNGLYGQAQKNEASLPVQIASNYNVPVVQQNYLPPITKTVKLQNYPAAVAETRPVEAPRPIATWPAQYLQTTTTSSPKVIRHRFLGTKCRENDVCISGGECRDGVCQCPENLYLRDGKCLRSAQLPRAAPSQPCEQGEMCTGGSICDNDSKKCVCAADHMIVEGVCRSKEAAPFSLPGESCARGEDCSGGSVCANGICQCTPDHYAENGYCRHVASQSSQIKLVSGSGLRFNSKSIPPRPAAKLCDENACRLPDCFCSTTGRKAPGGFASNDTPQFVVLTFDDAVNGRTLPDYKELFKTVMYRNPNGCPIKGTFFVSHEWTNYDGVQWLFQQGMELASNSISHVSLEGTNANRWLNEMDGQRRIMAKFANANEEEIVGLRAPQLILGGDEQFEMMTRAGFLYDNSMSVNPGVNGEPFWPQTLDHSVPWDCYDAQCPTASFPGVWAIPLNQFYGSYLPQIDSFRRSSMIRAAIDLNTTVDQLTNMIFSNFERAYLGNRAPYVLSLNADLLQLNGRNTGMQALQRFLEEIQYRKDVYVVTLKQLIEWMRNPVPLSHISQSEAVRCSQKFSQYPAISQSTCSKPNKCMYRTPGLGSQEHQFLTCSPCPEQYPWLDNPIGEALP